ncbi:zinc finger and BTB domain-containing protein 26-like isoform X5 [Gigantopelta aegis]|uniref:zinc finger and BTB domain-containing protein 26-like isoform X5 n=1 Tax=Gigantopelta aegis TaxID=1735272 RepID=UPI001B88B656|nr:zinc finger and BTB domain-containing protein 26-like isoform X5 [Gigantopelta aegis]XP_041370145.1 zinc finger and BTB domain-containing protein 26-like isoform X5 [Gigantopelta aegis]
MDKQYSVQFFTKFVEAMQKFCRDYIEFEQAVELSGYLSLEIDNYKKERYVLSEMVHSTGDVISESYCVKAFKTMKRLPSRSSEADLVLRDNTNMRRSGGYTDSQSLHQNIPSSGHSYRSRIHPAGTSHSSHLSSFSEQSSQRYVQSQSPMRQTQPPSFTQGSSGHGREPQDSLSSRGRPMQIQPRHSIQVPEGRGQKRSSTDGTGDGSSKKEKTDSDLESLYNAATNIASSSETTAATIGDIASTTASEPVSTSNESIRLPLTDMVTIKEENDVILLDDEGGGPSQLDVGSFANDSNSSSNLVDNSSLGAGDMFGSSVAGTGEGNPSGSSMSNEAMEENMLFKHLDVGRLEGRAAVQSIKVDTLSSRGSLDTHIAPKDSVFPHKKYPSWSKVFSCDQCPYQTIYRHVLKRHKRVHTGDFFQCHLCTCHFSDKLQLRHHLRGHAGNLRCKFCNKNFTYMSALKRHEKQHEKDSIQKLFDYP